MALGAVTGVVGQVIGGYAGVSVAIAVIAIGQSYVSATESTPVVSDAD